MASITIFEFIASPNAIGEVTWPADVLTTIDTASVTSVSLAATTRAVVITADADVRMRVNASGVTTAASASMIPILSVAPNQITVAPGAGQTLKFA